MYSSFFVIVTVLRFSALFAFNAGYYVACWFWTGFVKHKFTLRKKDSFQKCIGETTFPVKCLPVRSLRFENQLDVSFSHCTKEKTASMMMNVWLLALPSECLLTVWIISSSLVYRKPSGIDLALPIYQIHTFWSTFHVEIQGQEMKPCGLIC